MRRQEQLERTHAVLIDAAAHEFARVGVDAASTQVIIAHAGVSKGTMYHHFTTKHEMVEEILRKTRAVWDTLVAQARATPSRGLQAAIELSDEVGRTLQADVRVRAGLRIALDAPDLVAEPPFGWWEDAVVLFLQQAIADGEVDESIDTRVVARVLGQCMYGVCSLTLATENPERVTDHLTEMWRLVRSGLLKPPAEALP